MDLQTLFTHDELNEIGVASSSTILFYYLTANNETKHILDFEVREYNYTHNKQKLVEIFKNFITNMKNWSLDCVNNASV